MATLSVAALVVSHKQPDYLRQTLEGLLSQSLRPDQVMVIETARDEESIQIAKAFGYGCITPGDLRLGAAIEAGKAALTSQPGWLWILHDDSKPEPNALEQLAKAAEISPSLAIIGPKLLQWDEPIKIQQLGLTLTPSARPFLKVQDEYDQGQHDANGDVLAVSTAGMLVSNSLWEELGGLDDSTPVFAQDLELSLRARAKGYRVYVESSARVLHAGLAIGGQRDRGWVGGSRLSGLAKAHVHLATALWPAPLVALLYLFMPLIVLANLPINLLAKRPKRSLSQLSAWIWAWASIGTRLSARKKLRTLGTLKGAKTLYAKPSELRKRRLSQLIEEPEPEEVESNGLFASNHAWFLALPILASFAIWPTGAMYSDRLVPLSAKFSDVLDSVAASHLFIGMGIAAPSDPFNWFLALVSALSPLGPSFGLAAFVFIAPAIAFLATWKLAAVIFERPLTRTLVALGYSLSPFVLGGAYRGEVVELTALVFLPMTMLFALKALRSFSPSRSWRWTGLTGLSFAIVAVSAPVLAALLVLALVIGFVFYPKRALLVSWSLLPAAALLAPWLIFWAGEGRFELWTASAWAASRPLGFDLSVITVSFVVLMLLGAVGLAVSKPKPALLLSIFVGLATASSLYQPVVSSLAQLGAAALALLLLFGIALDSSNKGLRAFSSVAGTLLVAAQLALVAISPSPGFSYGPERQMPALIVASANASSQPVITLVIEASPDQVAGELVWDDGLGLEEQGLASRYLASDFDRAPIAQLVGSLVAGNPDAVQALLETQWVDFILLKGGDPNLIGQIEVGINAMDFLQSAGSSEFGVLWQTTPKTRYLSLPTSETRDWQLGLLALYLLLALPTPASIRGSRRAMRGER